LCVFALSIWLFAPQRIYRLLDSATIQLRLLLWKGSLGELFVERPFTGWGLGSFGVLSQRITCLVEPIAGPKHALHAHSWLVEVLVEGGILGATLYLALLGTLFRFLLAAWRAADAPSTALTLSGLIAGLVALLCGTLAGVWLNWWGGGWLFWTLAGLGAGTGLDVFSGRRTCVASPAGAGSRTAGVSLLLVSLAAAWAGLSVLRSEVLLFKGNALCKAGRFAQGAPLIERAGGMPVHSPDAPFWKAVSLEGLKQWDAAAEALDEASARRPGYARLHLIQARILAAQGAPRGALGSLRQAYEIQPTGENAISLAKYLQGLGDVDGALGIMRTQLARAAYPPLLHLYLAFESDAGRTGEARRFLSELRRNPPSNLRTWALGRLARWEAELSMLLEDWKRAVDDYETALAISPSDFQLWNDYALSLKKDERLEEADAAFARAVELNPEHFVPAINRLELALTRNQTALARRLLAKIDGMAVPPEAAARLDHIRAELQGVAPRDSLDGD
jgi:tetratricopeptide (TPR) repeat protein